MENLPFFDANNPDFHKGIQKSLLAEGINRPIF